MSETRDCEPQPVVLPAERKLLEASPGPAGPEPRASSAVVRTDVETGEMWIQL